jgi:hypothetical protein
MTVLVAERKKRRRRERKESILGELLSKRGLTLSIFDWVNWKSDIVGTHLDTNLKEVILRLTPVSS